ncbi:hypothetical protein SAMN05443572_105411 [Myxococcus fulvus]|uniref:Lipoprotein n=1 Tax=Myxococcus fulvus TaxID=33 RepID=A0A511T5G8_MYXFU|nr:hypothetical protein [Myxococcus fulvus]GEN09157.1 hypothetical protein MFU01_41940 [Myxococcus fulvus]SEU15935.1 hypothetical protein SAMN05443572_105411 [Myxococcus fulvus]
MKLVSKTLLAGFTAWVLSPLSALALPPDCDEICVEFEACDTTCAVPWTTRIINCGRWETEYHQPGACTPSLAAEEGEEESLMSSEEVDASWERSQE